MMSARHRIDPTHELRAGFRTFIGEHVAPWADTWDAAQRLPDDLPAMLGRERLLVATLPSGAGGLDLDAVAYGVLMEEVGRACASVRNLAAVQGMVAHAILRWGTPDQVEAWVGRIGAGEAVGAFALTEPAVGSDARSISTQAVRAGPAFVIDGRKRWISFGQRADVFLVFALLDGSIGAFLVERDLPGVRIEPIEGLLGLRASELAEVALESCVVPAQALVATGSMTFDIVATSALDYGRYSTACGCVGLGAACLQASLVYASERVQFGVAIAEHQLVQALLADMVTSVEAARALCARAGALRDAGGHDATQATLVAKYFSSAAALRVADAAVQVHGANGCSPDHSVARHLRDAKVQEIIEGTSQVQQLQIARLALTARRDRSQSVRRRPKESAGE